MFEVGQKVWDVVRGEGVVEDVRECLSTYPVVVGLGSGRYESYTLEGRYAEYDENISLYTHPVEVIKKVTKPSINWEHVRGEYKFLAQDVNGKAWMYCTEPGIGEDHWFTTSGECAKAHSYASYTPGTCNWEDSLVTRPEGL